LNDCSTRRDRCDAAGQQGPHWHGYAPKTSALIALKLSANAQFQDRPGACKLIDTAVSRGDQSMAQRLADCRINRALPAGLSSFASGLQMADTTVTPKTKVKTKTERPRLHKVILINDDYTPREFVVTVLKAEFRMTEDQAHKVMITAHRRGVCVVAVFTKDVAETKATRATDAGRAKGYPLLFTTEPEE
jgi:ATP-dependent Clp protease adaptor protein ClpS